jgi:hypothetical protein
LNRKRQFGQKAGSSYADTYDDPLHQIVVLQKQFAKLFWEFANLRAAGGHPRLLQRYS